MEKYPAERDMWEAFMGAAEENNRLEELGMDLTAGVPEPEKPRELGSAFAVTFPGAPGPEVV